MILTVFLAIILCVAMTLMLFSAIAFIQNTKFFSSAPKEAREVLIPRKKELFYGAHAIGWVLMKYRFFQFYFPEVESVYANRKYGYNIRSQLLKLLIIFPGASALAAWLCSYLVR